ncbi:MAG TPA: diguanylate cyclase [Ramlibacter sp.]|nr:diguanylate cyclase [Ramlibacter sp.]
MHTLAAGFWGAFFGTAALLLAGSLAAFARSLQRVALTAALSSLASSFFVAAYLGWVPVWHPERYPRLLAHSLSIVCAVLSLTMLATLGLMRRPSVAGRIRAALTALTVAVLAAGWLLDPVASLALSTVMAFSMGAAMFALGVRGTLRGDRLAGTALLGVTCVVVAVGGLSWIARDGAAAPWQVHALSAVAGIVYLATLATALWSRYSYLLELGQVVTHGPHYDPITRMRSHSETGQMVGLAFFNSKAASARPVGVITISIGNLYALENLHGCASVNHALFVCASRLRRCVPIDVEMGRLGTDGFLLLVRRAPDTRRLMHLGRLVAERLSRPVALSTSGAPADLEAGQAHWVAQVGVGVLAATPELRPSAAVAMARSMSRAAWSYASRVAWHDHASGQMRELPAVDPA